MSAEILIFAVCAIIVSAGIHRGLFNVAVTLAMLGLFAASCALAPACVAALARRRTRGDRDSPRQ